MGPHRRINLFSLQPVVSDFRGVGEGERRREPEGDLVQPMDLSVMKQEASVEPSAPKEEEPGSREGGEREKAPFRQLTGLMDFPDPRLVVDNLILRPKVEQMDENPGDYGEIDYDMEPEEKENFCGLISRGSTVRRPCGT